MSIATRTVAGSRSLPPPAGRRTEPEAFPEGRWQPRPRAVVAVSTSDPQAPDAGLAQPDVLLVRLGELAPGDPGRIAVRARAIEWYLPMAGYLARRFAGRGEPVADLTQVAVVGLIKAVDRFDADRGVLFASYAIPTIVGELKRHFRDTAWNVRVPRSVQELKLNLVSVTEDLAQLLQHSPTTAEVAARLGVSPREVLQARGTATAYRPVSIQQTAPGGDDLYLIDLLPVTDRGIEAVDNRETLRVLLAALPARDQMVIRMRFYADMTQSQIATQIGVSQMQVSRLLTRSLTRLHDGILADSDTDTAATRSANGTRRATTQATRIPRRGAADRPSAPDFHHGV
jgi:RNA polymerase sigma-B factor